MKWAGGGPIVARSVVYAVVQLEKTTVECSREEVGPRYRLYELESHWEQLAYKSRFDAMVLRLHDEEWLDALYQQHVRHRASWVVIDSGEKKRKWFSESAAAHRVLSSAPVNSHRGARTLSASLLFQILR